jgi:hypothetical protein
MLDLDGIAGLFSVVTLAHWRAQPKPVGVPVMRSARWFR